MGWKGVTVMDQRIHFIAEYLKGYFPFNLAHQFLVNFWNDIAPGWEYRDIRFGYLLRDLIDRLLDIGKIRKFHHLDLLWRKPFSDMSHGKFFSHFFEVDDLHDV